MFYRLFLDFSNKGYFGSNQNIFLPNCFTLSLSLKSYWMLWRTFYFIYVRNYGSRAISSIIWSGNSMFKHTCDTWRLFCGSYLYTICGCGSIWLTVVFYNLSYTYFASSLLSPIKWNRTLPESRRICSEGLELNIIYILARPATVRVRCKTSTRSCFCPLMLNKCMPMEPNMLTTTCLF